MLCEYAGVYLMLSSEDRRDNYVTQQTKWVTPKRRDDVGTYHGSSSLDVEGMISRKPRAQGEKPPSDVSWAVAVLMAMTEEEGLVTAKRMWNQAPAPPKRSSSLPSPATATAKFILGSWRAERRRHKASFPT